MAAREITSRHGVDKRTLLSLVTLCRSDESHEPYDAPSRCFILRRLLSLVRSLKSAINAVAVCATGAAKRAQCGIGSGADRGTIALTISIAELRSGSPSPVSHGTFRRNLGVSGDRIRREAPVDLALRSVIG
jgi:hypothetical protein